MKKHVLERRISQHMAHWVLMIVCFVVLVPVAWVQGQVTPFEGKQKGVYYIGYVKQKWYFASNDEYFIYDKSMKQLARTSFKMPKGWNKAVIMNMRVVDQEVQCLITAVDNGDRERSFAACKVQDSGELVLLGDGKPLFTADERNKAVGFGFLEIDLTQRNRTLSFGKHVDYGYSPDSTWLLVVHAQKKKGDDGDKFLQLSLFVVDARFNLVSSLTVEKDLEDKESAYGKYYITNEGEVRYALLLSYRDPKKKRQRSTRNEVISGKCPLGESKFKEKKTPLENVVVDKASLFSFEDDQVRLVMLGRSDIKADYTDRLVVMRCDPENGDFKLEYDKHIWKMKGMPDEKYQNKRANIFRIVDCRIDADGHPIVFFDDLLTHIVTLTDKNGVVTTKVFYYVTLMFAANLKPDVQHMDYLTLHRYEMLSTDSYEILKNATTGQFYVYLNTNEKRHGPKAKPLTSYSRAKLDKSKAQRMLARFAYTPGKGFKYEVVLPPDKAKKEKFCGSWPTYPIGPTSYVVFMVQKFGASYVHPALLKL